MSEKEITCIICPAFYEKAIKDKHDTKALGQIIKHISFENQEFSKIFSKLLL